MDVLLVSRNLIHLPVIDGSEPYDRMVLWVRREFLARYSTPEADLATCFDLTARRGFHLYRPRGEDRLRYRGYFEELEAAEKDGGFAAGGAGGHLCTAAAGGLEPGCTGRLRPRGGWLLPI